MLWLSKGRLVARRGTLRFITAGGAELAEGAYDIPFQSLHCIFLQPGTTVSHDALRLCARHGTGIVATGNDGVRLYSAMPFGPDSSHIARNQCLLWADESSRRAVARRMYAWRLGEILPSDDIAVLRGIEGARVKESYRLCAQKFRVTWRGRRYDRSDPTGADMPNQALNHAATAVQAAAMLAVVSVGALPQLGFIHEASGRAFALDIADLYRESVTLPIAFGAVVDAQKGNKDLERTVRLQAGREFRRRKLIAGMIGKIKEVLRADDGHRDP